MSPYGLSIDTAMSAFEAINKIRDGSSYDIIFMDHMMPGMDGIEATKIIRSMNYKNIIIALTANALAGQAEMFLQNDFDDFISKPIDIRQLNQALNKYVRDKQTPEVLEAANKQREKLRTRLNQPIIDPQLAEFFLRDAKKAANIMEAIFINKCRRADDVSMFIINIHAMKSALANIGETDLSIEAQSLEQAGRDKKTEVIIEELPSFMKKLYSVIHRLEAKEGYIEENDKEEGDLTLLKELLQEIKAACSVYNKKAAKDLLAQIREKSWSKEIEEKLGKIAGLLLHSDFDETSKLIEEYLK
jgi:CheY-like chemotaxis protein/HPt (histidine-containing phosphotransfer) domain-containing protein